MIELSRTDAEHLLTQPAFMRFLAAAIQSAGILGHHAPANGQLGRDLGHFEGRRSLGFDLLMMAHDGQPEAIRNSDAQGLTTLNAALRAIINPNEGKPNGRRNRDLSRYDSIGGNDDADQ